MTVSAGLFAAERTDWNLNWPQWRGPLGTGEAPFGAPPLEWSESTNVRWKVGIPGAGTATPIVWGDKVFVLTAIPSGEPEAAASPEGDAAAAAEGERDRGRGAPAPSERQQFVVLCLDRATGQTLWRRTACEVLPHEGHHRDHGFASASPVTDGEVLLAYFGSRGLYAYDLEGALKWQVDLGDMQTRNAFGEGSSPALHGDTVVVVWDHEGEDDFVVALDKRTGKELWRTGRDESTNWTTPLIVEVNGEAQVVVAGRQATIGYDLQTGQALWSGPELTMNVIPTPVVAEGVVYVTSGFRGAALNAIRLGESGELAGTDSILWSHNRNTPYVPSPVLTGNRLYFASRNNAILTCLDARTGEPHFSEERLDGISGIYASPVAAGDRVYVLGRNGTCLVLDSGPELRVLARNQLDDQTDASIAVAGEDLFIRGHQQLYCIADR